MRAPAEPPFCGPPRWQVMTSGAIQNGVPVEGRPGAKQHETPGCNILLARACGICYNLSTLLDVDDILANRYLRR